MTEDGKCLTTDAVLNIFAIKLIYH